MAGASTLSALLDSSLFLSPTSIPTEAPPTTEDPIQRHLSAIIGVPVGVGLSLLVLGSCALWLFLSSYLKYRREEREQATNTTNLNTSKGLATGGRQQKVSEDPGSNGGRVSSPPTSPRSPHSPSPSSPPPSVADTKM